MKYTTYNFFISCLLSICIVLQTSFFYLAPNTTIHASSTQDEQPEYYDQLITLYTKGSKDASKKISIKTNNSNIDNIYFLSSNTSIAKVNRTTGKISALKKGTTFITVYIIINETTQKYIVKVKVKNPAIKITNPVKTLKIKKNYKFKAKTYGLSEAVCWKVSNKKIATISKKTGKLRTKKAGKVIVTASCKNISKRIAVRIVK